MRQVIFICLVLPILLTGCASYKVVGQFDDYNEVFIGTVDANLLIGGGEIKAVGQQSQMVCTGTAYITHIPSVFGCAGQRGKAPMKCSDGRELDVDFIVHTCTSGEGIGTDQNGNTFQFVFGLKEKEAQLALAKAREKNKSKPKLPQYRPKETRKEKGFATGSGFYVSNNGIVVTNFHVIDEANSITVVDHENKKELTAKVVSVDPVNDLAILKVESETKPIPLASHCQSRKGDEVLTLGYPLIAIQGQEQKASFGRINSLSGIKDDIRMMQIDVPIQPGNSGAPLINTKGEVIGIVTSTLNQIVTLKETGSLPQNVNFAVKVDYLHPLLRKADVHIPENTNSRKAAMADIVANRESSVLLVIAK